MTDSESGIDHYRFEWDGGSQEVPALQSSATVAGLSAGTDYEITMVAVDGAGNESASSDPISVTTFSGAQYPYRRVRTAPTRIEAEDFDADPDYESGGSSAAFYNEYLSQPWGTDGLNTALGNYRSEEAFLFANSDSGYRIGALVGTEEGGEGSWWEYTVAVDEPGTYELFIGVANSEAVESGDVPESELDDMVTRVLLPYARTGHLDGEKAGSEPAQNTTAHQNLARQVAEEGSVLLKNADETLPLDPDALDSLALIGPDVDEAVVGGGGSSDVQPPYAVDPVSAIEASVGDGVEVTYEPGVPDASLVPADVLTPPSGDGDGLRAEYYGNQSWDGEPETTRVDAQVDTTDTEVDAGTGVGENDFSVRWTGTIAVPGDGEYVFELTSDDGSNLCIDDEEVVDNGGEHGPRSAADRVELAAGDHDITVEWFEAGGGAEVSLGWATPAETTGLDRAREAAAEADAALVFAAGSSSEGVDRPDMVLDGVQNTLIGDVAAANDDAAAVLRTGGPVEMPWADAIPSILQCWYPGMEDGNAVANVVFGEVNPGGKLPVTFGESVEDYPASEASQYPGVDGVAAYDEGIFVGYRWFDQQGIEPLYPFGHGESYTDFAFENLRAPDSADAGETATVEVDVTNAGDRAGSEVVQLYVRDLDASVARPSRELNGFAKVTIDAGETTTVSIDLDREAFAFWDPDTGRWTVEDGDFELLVGASSRDIRAKSTITVAGGDEQASDTTAPTAPEALSVVQSTTSSITVDWSLATDSETGVDQYVLSVDGTTDREVSSMTTRATVPELDPETEYSVSVAAVDYAGNRSSTVTVSGSTVAENDDSVAFAVNAGGNTVTANGITYQADTAYSGGQTATTGDPIEGTETPAIYQSERYGTFSYEIPVEEGVYDVVMHFTELYWEEDGARVFDVSAEGVERVSGLDIHSEVGHDAAHVERVTGVQVTDGTLELSFSVDADNAKLSAIEVLESEADPADVETATPTATDTASPTPEQDGTTTTENDASAATTTSESGPGLGVVSALGGLGIAGWRLARGNEQRDDES